MKRSVKTAALVIGDVLLLYFGLFLTLFIRYRLDFYTEFVQEHFLPFSIIFLIWLIVFYVAGLYDPRLLRNNLNFLRILVLALFVNAILAISFFYLVPAFGISPKTNLFIFIVIFGILAIIWRRFFNQIAAVSAPLSEIILIGQGEIEKEISGFLKENPQLGYGIKEQFQESLPPSEISKLEKLIGSRKIEFLVLPQRPPKSREFAKIFYKFLISGVTIKDLPSFYELIFQKVPLTEINDEWILENLSSSRKFYDGLKRGAEFFMALVLSTVLLPIFLFLAILVKIFSPGPAIYQQKRIGQNGREFTIYKFRTMKIDAEKGGAQWAKENDTRVTFIGKILKYTHLDELPQLWNILKGDLSFIGPRPERPEFIAMLSKEIPYYETRQLIKPGVTGWAQLNYRYGASVEDAYHKLEYDIYYLKNRSFILDIAIVLKTVKLLFISPK